VLLAPLFNTDFRIKRAGCRYIHRDIKPENFLIGVGATKSTGYNPKPRSFSTSTAERPSTHLLEQSTSSTLACRSCTATPAPKSTFKRETI
jgi:serine/threonine protein kinase